MRVLETRAHSFRIRTQASHFTNDEDGLFEHPASDLPCPSAQAIEVVLCRNDFPAAC